MFLLILLISSTEVILLQVPLSRVKETAALKDLPDFVHRLLAFLFQGKPPAPMNAPQLFAHLRKRGIAVRYFRSNIVQL